MPPKKSELPGSPKIQELDEEEADESPLLPMTPESKQLAAVIATAVAAAMAVEDQPLRMDAPSALSGLPVTACGACSSGLI